MKRILNFVLLLVLFVFPLSVSAGSDNQLSSKSAVERLPDVEKNNKELIKQLKKNAFYKTEVWAERWTDGQIYYILKLRSNTFTVVRNGTERVFGDKKANPGTDYYYFYYGSIELTEREGKPFFLVNKTNLYSYKGEYIGENAEVKQMGDTKVFCSESHFNQDVTYNLSLFDGTPVYRNVDQYWYIPASDRALCRIGDFSFPSMPMNARFMSMRKKDKYTPNDRYFISSVDGKELAVNLTDKAIVGNAYYGRCISQPTVSLMVDSTSVNVAGYKIVDQLYRLEGGKSDAYKPYDYDDAHYCDLELFKADGTLLLDSLAWADFSSNDQVIYYYTKNNTGAIRCGALNPLYPQLSVPPLFAEVKYIADGSGVGKPWVRLTSFGKWEPFNPQKNYAFNALSKTQRLFEENQFFFYCSDLEHVDIEKLTDEEKVMYVYAAGMTGNYALHEQQKIIDNYCNGIAPTQDPEYNDSHYTYSSGMLTCGRAEDSFLNRACELIEYVEAHADRKSETYKMVQAMKDYVKFLEREVSTNLYINIGRAKQAYKDYQAQQLRERAAEEQRMAEAKRQRTNALVSAALNVLSGLMNNLAQGGRSGSTAVTVKSSGVRATKEHTGHYNLDNMKLPDNFNYFPVYTGVSSGADFNMPSGTFSGGGASAGSYETTPSSSSSVKKCQLCLSHPGKCNLCGGRGEYIPSVSVGHYVKCGKCNGTGQCSGCNGTGTR